VDTLTTFPVDYTVNLPRTAVMEGGRPFCVTMTRIGAANSTNYFKVCAYELAAGETSDYPYLTGNGSTYTARSPTALMECRLEGAAHTSTVAAWMAAVGQGGQFLARVEIEDSSGVWTSVKADRIVPFRQEIEELLRAGSSDQRKMLASVTPERVVRVYKAPLSSAPNCLIDKRGEVRTLQDHPLLLPGEAVGSWGLIGSGLAGAAAMWIDQVTWQDGRLKVSG
jgi:hypothetical protein